MTRCLQCGAGLPPGHTCRDLFDLGQALEMEQPAAYAVHHLSVPTYYLQHNLYARAGWQAARELLARFLAGTLTPAEARRRLAASPQPASPTRGPKQPGVEAIPWTATIASVRLTPPEAYCADVRAWAAAVLLDTAPLAAAAPSPVRRPSDD